MILGAGHPRTLISITKVGLELKTAGKQQDHLENPISLMSDAVRLSATLLSADDNIFKKASVVD